MNRLTIPLDVTGTEALDFVGPSPPELSGPGTAPLFTPRDKQVLFRVLTWNNPDPPPQGRRGKIIQPEYDFNEIAKATDTDGILRSSRDKQLVCMMKDQWWFGGRNPRTVAYIQRRINEISRMSPMSFNMVLRSCAKDLIEFGNFFLYLHRQNKFSSGKPTEINAKRVDPIAAIHPVDVTTMRPVLGDTVEIRSWIQTLESPSLMSSRISRLDYTTPDRNSIKLDIREVIHGFAWRRTGFVYGTPPALPVLDDVRALRRLEEITEIVSHRHAFPMVHISVGTEKQPARQLADGSNEIDVVKDAYEAMKMEGAFITSERAKVTAITLRPQDLSPLLQHFTNRVVTGLGLSDVDIGRGSSANRGTSQVMVKSLLDRCRELQQIVADFILHQLLDVLLVEGGFDVSPENRVYLRFPEVDIDRMMAIGNFATDLYLKNMLTESEARLMMGRDPLDPSDRRNMHWELIEKPSAIIKAVDEPYTAAAKAVANRNRPSNQFGTKSAKTLPKNDSMTLVTENLKQLKTDIVLYIEDCLSKKKSIDDRELWELADLAVNRLSDSLIMDTEAQVASGFAEYAKISKSAETFVYTGALKRRFTKHCIKPLLDRLVGTRDRAGEFGVLVKRLRTCTDGNYVLKAVSFFDTWESVWFAVCDSISQVAVRYGTAQAAWIDGAHNVGWLRDGHLKQLSPAQANYHELVDRPDEVFQVVLTDKLPSKISLSVAEAKRDKTGCTIKLTSNIEDILDLSKPGRHVSVLLDTGERTMLPDDLSEGWTYDRDGSIRIPHLESGIIEVWDGGRTVGKTRFVIPDPEAETK